MVKDMDKELIEEKTKQKNKVNGKMGSLSFGKNNKQTPLWVMIQYFIEHMFFIICVML